MASKVDIINRALQHNGARRVVAADDSANSRELNSMYNTVRDAELRKRVWTFSIRRTSLAASTDTVNWDDEDLQYFPFPTGYLRLVEIKDRPDYLLEAEGIVTDASAPIYIRYVERVEDEARFDAMFIEMLAISLAQNATESVKSSKSDTGLMTDLYKMYLDEAVLANSIELPPLDESEDEWLLARV